MTTITLAIKNEKLSTLIQTSQNATRQITLNNASKEKVSSRTQILRPLRLKDLVPRLGTSEDMVRIFLLKNYPEAHVKNKSWSINPEFAKQIEKDYKNQVRIREAERKLRIERELSGYM
jgi:hypothetical protein